MNDGSYYNLVIYVRNPYIGILPLPVPYHHLSLVPSRARANAQTPSGDNARVSWARKCYPAKILAGQSESTSCIIA